MPGVYGYRCCPDNQFPRIERYAHAVVAHIRFGKRHAPVERHVLIQTAAVEIPHRLRWLLHSCGAYLAKKDNERDGNDY